MNEKMLSRMTDVIFEDLLVRREEKARDGQDLNVEKEALVALQMCFKALDMNICVDDEALFETCLLKHVRPFFSSLPRGREAALAFVSTFVDFLKEEGDGDLQLARMRTALYRRETLTDFSVLLKRRVEGGE